jgi:hypothetical protein
LCVNFINLVFYLHIFSFVCELYLSCILFVYFQFCVRAIFNIVFYLCIFSFVCELYLASILFVYFQFCVWTIFIRYFICIFSFVWELYLYSILFVYFQFCVWTMRLGYNVLQIAIVIQQGNHFLYILYIDCLHIFTLYDKLIITLLYINLLLTIRASLRQILSWDICLPSQC